VQQPLINPDLIYQRKMAASQVSSYAYQQAWTKANIRFEVEKAYHQLQLAYRAQQVVNEALHTTLSIDSLTEHQFNQGLVQASDRLSVKVQVAKMQTDLNKAETDIQNASNYLDLLLGGDGTALYACADTLDFSITSAPVSDSVSMERADFMATQKAIEASDWQIQSGKMSYLPKLNAFGSYQLNDSHPAGFGAGSYLAGVRLSWDIFKGNTTRKTIARQQLEKGKLALGLSQQKTQSRLALQQAKRSLANNYYEIQQYTQSIGQATEALRILRNRYRQGLAKTTDIMAAATAVSEQELWLAQALAGRAITIAYIQLLTQPSQP
jgi:outer membrane protein TolC